MTIETKICGINSAEALDAAAGAGARWVGFVFFPPSPRAVEPAAAAALAARAPAGVERVGLFADPDDALLEAVLAQVPLDLIQLHGKEGPARAAEVRSRFGRPVMKALGIARVDDLAAVEPYLPVVDRLMFDAKPPKAMTGALPGGNAVAFDWRLLAGRRWPRPWLLAGGLDPDNVAEAVQVSGARAVDVSSGVESARGVKSPELIRRFLEATRSLRPAA